MQVQKAIFPGIIVGIVFMLVMINLFSSPRKVAAENQAAADTNEQVTNIAPSAEQTNTDDSSGECLLSQQYPASIQQWCNVISKYAHENGLDPNLVSAVMLQESNGQPDAYSKSGAVGLLQVMPSDGLAASFVCKNGPCFADRPNMEALFDPEYNVAYGTQMLANLIQHHGDVREALKAYGPRDVGYYYADLVLNIMNRYR